MFISNVTVRRPKKSAEATIVPFTFAESASMDLLMEDLIIRLVVVPIVAHLFKIHLVSKMTIFPGIV